MNFKHGMSKTPIYETWWNMVNRCNNKKCNDYPDYGGRGITVCKSWLHFDNFYDDVGDKPDGLTIERINNEKGYYKENVKWTTHLEQAHNRRRMKTNTSGVIGVHWIEAIKKYRAQIMTNGKRVNLGCFDSLKDAAISRKIAQEKYW